MLESSITQPQLWQVPSSILFSLQSGLTQAGLRGRAFARSVKMVGFLDGGGRLRPAMGFGRLGGGLGLGAGGMVGCGFVVEILGRFRLVCQGDDSRDVMRN